MKQKRRVKRNHKLVKHKNNYDQDFKPTLISIILSFLRDFKNSAYRILAHKLVPFLWSRSLGKSDSLKIFIIWKSNKSSTSEWYCHRPSAIPSKILRKLTYYFRHESHTGCKFNCKPWSINTDKNLIATEELTFTLVDIM